MRCQAWDSKWDRNAGEKTRQTQMSAARSLLEVEGLRERLSIEDQYAVRIVIDAVRRMSQVVSPAAYSIALAILAAQLASDGEASALN
jgi:hypothetical protein